ncbi:hypothetical protein EAE96_005162 [Botrytis aclada]|nr:hypothetical protein EAE96_005162 [Botrytis aclada]
MTIVRAIVRRGMLDSPVAQNVPQKYEIYWLSLRISNIDDNLQHLRASNDKGKPSCYVCGRFGYHECKVLYWKLSNEITTLSQADLILEPVTNEPLAQDSSDIQKSLSEEISLFEPLAKDPTAQDFMKVWQSLQKEHPLWDSYKKGLTPESLIAITRLEVIVERLKLTGWLEPSERSSMAQKVANLRERLGILTGWYDPEIKACAISVATAIEKIMALFSTWPGSTFHWFIELEIDKSSANITDKVKLTATKGRGKDSWYVSASAIESIISLWIYHLGDHHQVSHRDQSGNAESVPVIRSYQRVIGPAYAYLTRDLKWWANAEMSKALGRFTWNGPQDRECLSLGFGGKGFSGPRSGTSNPPEKLYATMANVFKEKFLAQHIFSNFMWTIIGSLPTAQTHVECRTEVMLPSDDKFKLDAKHTNWDSLRLTNEKIEDMTKAVEISGLGSMEDAQLLIIPPLSYASKLPSGKLIDEGRLESFEKVGFGFVVGPSTARNKTKIWHTPLHQQIIYNPSGRLNLNALKPYFDVPDILGWTPLHYAVVYSHLAVAALVDKKQELVSNIDLAGRTPLHYAVMGLSKDLEPEETKEIIFKLLEVDLEPQPGRDGLFPLHWAVRANNFIATRMPLENELQKRTMDKRDYWEMTPVHLAAAGGHLKILKLLLDAGSTPQIINVQDKLLQTPLHIAAKNLGSLNTVDIILELLNRGANVGIRDKNHKTALELAAEMEHDYQKSTNGLDISKRGLEIERTTSIENTKLAIRHLLDKENLGVDGGKLLLWAAKSNFKTPFDVLIGSKKTNEDDKYTDVDNKRSILHYAVDAEPGIMVDRILKRWKLDTILVDSLVVEDDISLKTVSPLDLRDSLGMAALMLAAGKGFELGVTRLLASRANTYIKDDNGWTALSWAAKRGQMNIVRVLNKRRSIMESAAENIPMSLAIFEGNFDIVDFFLKPEGKSSPDDTDDNGFSMLCLVVVYEQRKIVELLIDHKAGIEKQSGPDSRTPLSWAAGDGNLEIIKLLLRKKASLEAKDTKDRTPLVWAVISGQLEAVKAFLAEGNIESYDTTPLLFQAVYDENPKIVQLLLANGAKIDKKGWFGRTPLFRAIYDENSAIVQLLLWGDADVKIVADNGRTPLFQAVCNQNTSIINLLLNARANITIDVMDDDGRTPLSRAIYMENPEIVHVLLERGADVRRHTIYGKTLLQESAECSTEEILNDMLSHDAGITEVDIQGRNVFHISCDRGRTSMLKTLIHKYQAARGKEASYDLFGPAVRDKQGRDVFHHAALSKSAETVSYLLKLSSGRYLHRADINGWTPLHWAAQAGGLKVVQMLLELHSDAKILESIKKWTPRQNASYNNHNQIVELLEPFSIPDEVLPSAGLLHESLVCDGCNCKMRGSRFHCQNCVDFDFCEKCKVTSDTTHPNHEFDEIPPNRKTEPKQELSPPQEIDSEQDDSSSQNRSVYENSVKDDVAT